MKYLHANIDMNTLDDLPYYITTEREDGDIKWEINMKENKSFDDAFPRGHAKRGTQPCVRRHGKKWVPVSKVFYSL